MNVRCSGTYTVGEKDASVRCWLVYVHAPGHHRAKKETREQINMKRETHREFMKFIFTALYCLRELCMASFSGPSGKESLRKSQIVGQYSASFSEDLIKGMSSGALTTVRG